MQQKSHLWPYVRNALLFQVVAAPICMVIYLLMFNPIFGGWGYFPADRSLGEWLATTLKGFALAGITFGVATSVLHTWILSSFHFLSRSAATRQSVVGAAGLGTIQVIPVSYIADDRWVPLMIVVPGLLVYGWVVGHLWAKEAREAVPIEARAEGWFYVYLCNAILFLLVAVPVCICVSLTLDVLGSTTSSPPYRMPLRRWLADTLILFFGYGFTGGLGLSPLHTWVLRRFRTSAPSTTVWRSMVSAGVLAALQMAPLLFWPWVSPFFALVPGALAYGWVVGRIASRAHGR